MSNFWCSALGTASRSLIRGPRIPPTGQGSHRENALNGLILSFKVNCFFQNFKEKPHYLSVRQQLPSIGES